MPRKPKTKTTKTTKTTKDDKRYRESLVAAHTYYRTGTHVSNLFKKLAKVYTEHPEFVIVVVGMIISTIFRIGSAPAQRIIINILERAKVYGGDAAAYVHLMWKRLFHGPPPPPPPKPRWGVPTLPAIPSLAPLMTFITELIKGGGSIGLEIYRILQEAYKMNPSFFMFIGTIVSSFVIIIKKTGGQNTEKLTRQVLSSTPAIRQACAQGTEVCERIIPLLNLNDPKLSQEEKDQARQNLWTQLPNHPLVSAMQTLNNPKSTSENRNQAQQTLNKYYPELAKAERILQNSKSSPEARAQAKATIRTIIGIDN